MDLIIGKDDRITIVYDRIIKGDSVLEIKESLAVEGWTDNSIKRALTGAYKKLQSKVEKEAVVTIALHIKRYETIYARSLEKARKAKHFMLANYSYLDVIEALFRKERVLGFHLKRTNIQVNNTKNKVSVIKEQPIIESKYDFTKLALAEKIEIRQLLQKVKPDYVPPVIEVKLLPAPKSEDNQLEILKKHGLFQ